MKTLIITFFMAYLLVETYQQQQCWTRWFNRDGPSGTGDYETLTNLRREYRGMVCGTPIQIQVLTVAGANASSTGDVIAVSDTTTGFVCKNKAQKKKKKKCSNYKVRFMCPPSFCKVCWTKWYDRDDPSGVGDWELLTELKKENRGQICAYPLSIQVQTVNTSTPAASTGQTFSILSPTQGFACVNAEQKNKLCQDYQVRFGCHCM